MSKRNFKIIHSPEYYKYHTINTDEVQKYGIKKAAILGNIDKFQNVEKTDLSKNFPYIEEKEFNKLVEELIVDGLLMEKNHG